MGHIDESDKIDLAKSIGLLQAYEARGMHLSGPVDLVDLYVAECKFVFGISI